LSTILSTATDSRATEPRATYRLQLTAGFGFAAARSLVPYLRDLGVSHLYLSPCFQARPGSSHGYDVIDPRRLSDALGGATEFRRLSGAARDAGMGLVLDAVPNHMAADDANPFWADRAQRERFFDLDPVTGRWRRFFDIDDLAGVRQEDPSVFEATHELLLGLVREGLVDGLRVDHPDGLADPAGYLSRLRELGVARVWVEKILSPAHPPERLRNWPVCGTVGYDFLNDACALFVDPRGEAALTAVWSLVSGDRRGFAEVAAEAKLEQVQRTFWPEVERLLRELSPPVPVPLETLQRALASLPVYRTYVDPVARMVSPEDRTAIAHLDPAVARILLLEQPAPARFVTRFQQTTPAVMAKGVEDTAFYRYARLLALNEVGGDPSRFGIGVEAFHTANLERAERFPLSLLTTQTHDCKRSADVRACIAALASMTEEWASFVERCFALTARLGSDGAPDNVERYFLLQTLVGAWPIERRRVQEYMVKALREAKRNTSWVAPRWDWEDAVSRFCGSLYADGRFLAELEQFVGRVAPAGDRAALGQLVLKLTAPGIPDIYQGDELPFRALVDPDNRRPVDWRWRRSTLSRLMGGSPPVAETWKMFVTVRLLGLRARRPGPFAGSYEPVGAGPAACAFLRGGEVLVVVGVSVGGVAPEGVLVGGPGGRWRDVLRGDVRSFGAREPVGGVVDEHGLGVFERL
jgi:(1->4)-alpha-D-glucan 1-alpha-D-glucosylmutase